MEILPICGTTANTRAVGSLLVLLVINAILSPQFSVSAEGKYWHRYDVVGGSMVQVDSYQRIV